MIDKSPEGVLHRLIDTIGLDAALKYAAENKLTGTKSVEEIAAANKADDGGLTEVERAEVVSNNPFVRGPNFNLKEQARLYTNDKTRALAISLAKSAGIVLPENPTRRDLTAKSA